METVSAQRPTAIASGQLGSRVTQAHDAARDGTPLQGATKVRA
jgi:hypothetical protein